jgi:hypothetical protein
MAATLKNGYNAFEPVHYLAFEPGNKEGKLGFTMEFRQRPRIRTIVSGDLEGLQREIRLAKKRFSLP